MFITAHYCICRMQNVLWRKRDISIQRRNGYGSLPAHADISAAEFHHFFDKKVDHIGSSYVNAPVPVYTRYALQLFISGFPISRSHEVMAAVFITTLMSLTFVAYTKTSITGRRSFRTTQPSTLRGTVKWVSAFGLSNNKWRWWV